MIMPDTISISRTDRVDSSENLTRLFSELHGREFIPDVIRINKLIEEGSLALYLVLDGDYPVGMASVIPCRTASKDKLWIEDVCILSDRRGLGLGRKLMDYLIADASALFGNDSFWLTSRPSRTAARTMYKSLGFEEYETGVFGLTITD